MNLNSSRRLYNMPVEQFFFGDADDFNEEFPYYFVGFDRASGHICAWTRTLMTFNNYTMFCGITIDSLEDFTRRRAADRLYEIRFI